MERNSVIYEWITRMSVSIYFFSPIIIKTWIIMLVFYGFFFLFPREYASEKYFFYPLPFVFFFFNLYVKKRLRVEIIITKKVTADITFIITLLKILPKGIFSSGTKVNGCLVSKSHLNLIKSVLELKLFFESSLEFRRCE